MFNSGVKIVPDTQRLDHEIARLGQIQAFNRQQEIQATKEQIAEFKNLVDKSFYPVYDNDRKEYLDRREEYLDNVRKVYQDKGGNGGLNATDYMGVNEQRRDLETWIAKYAESKKLMNDAITKVSFDTSQKIDKEKTWANIKQIATLPVDERYSALTSGGYMVQKPTSLDITSISKKIAQAAYSPVKKGENLVKNEQSGMWEFPSGQVLDQGKLDKLASVYWDRNRQNLMESGYENKNQFIEDVKLYTPTKEGTDIKKIGGDGENTTTSIPQTITENGGPAWYFGTGGTSKDNKSVIWNGFTDGTGKTYNEAVITKVTPGADGELYAMVTVPKIVDKDWNQLVKDGVISKDQVEVFQKYFGFEQMERMTKSKDPILSQSIPVPFKGEVRSLVTGIRKLEGLDQYEKSLKTKESAKPKEKTKPNVNPSDPEGLFDFLPKVRKSN